MRLTNSFIIGVFFVPSIIFQAVAILWLRHLTVVKDETSMAITPNDVWSFRETEDRTLDSQSQERNKISSSLNAALVGDTLPLNNDVTLKENKTLLNNSLLKANEQQPISIIIDWEDDEEESWIPRLAFAKMLQIEAKTTHGVETELIMLVDKRPKGMRWYKCFSRLKESFSVVVGIGNFKRRKLEQMEWLGDEAKLLEATQDTWENGLRLISQLSRSESVSFSTSFSLPFLRVKSPPKSLGGWNHLERLVEILTVERSCCEVPPIERPEKMELHTTVFIKDSKSSNILPSHLSNLIQRPKLTKILFVTDQPEDLSEHAATLQNEHGYAIRFIHPGSVGARSITSRLCLLTQNAGHELLVASNGSSLGIWAAMSNNASQVVRIVEDSDGYDEPFIKYGAADPRSRIKVEKLAQDVPNTSFEVGSIGNPLSLVVRVADKLEERIAQGYVLQFYLKEKYHIYAQVFLLLPRKNNKLSSEIKLIHSCFPELSNLGTISEDNDEFDIRRYQMQTFGILDAFELRDKKSVDLIPEILKNTMSSSTSWIRRASQRVVQPEIPTPLLTFPFISVDQNFIMKALQDSRKKLDFTFATNTSLSECQELHFSV